MGVVKYLSLPEEKDRKNVDRLIAFLSLRICMSASRHPLTPTDFYKYLFDNLDPNDSRNILSVWISVVQKPNTKILDQKEPWWPITAERTDVLFFILCGDHGQPVPFWKLYQALRESNTNQSTRSNLTMAITLRRAEPWWLDPSHISYSSSMPDKAPCPIGDEQCFCRCTPQHTKAVHSSATTSHMLQSTSLSTAMARPMQMKESTRTFFEPSSFELEQTVQSQTSTKPLCDGEPLSRIERPFAWSSTHSKQVFEDLGISFYQDSKHPKYKGPSTRSRSHVARLGSVTEPRFECEVLGCSKSFKYRKGMRRHMKIHSREGKEGKRNPPISSEVYYPPVAGH